MSFWCDSHYYNDDNNHYFNYCYHYRYWEQQLTSAQSTGAGLTRAEIMKMKQRRRTLKNRGYAASCRTKRIEQKDELEAQRTQVEQWIESLRQENSTLAESLNSIRTRYQNLVQYSRERNIPLPKEFLEMDF